MKIGTCCIFCVVQISLYHAFCIRLGVGTHRESTDNDKDL